MASRGHALSSLAVLLALAGAAHATDTTAPTASFDTSFVSGEVDDLNGGLSGKAKDTDSGVLTVKARIVRNWTGANEWWDGGGWVSAVAELACSKSAPDVNGEVTWQTTATMPSATSQPQQLVPGRYTLQVIVTDANNNTATVSNVIGVKPIDTTKPVTTITYPSVNDLQFSRLSAFTGTTTDPENSPGVPGSGVTQVGVRLRRVGNGQTLFWNGTAWVTNATQLPSMTELSWVRNSNLPSGSTNLPVSGTTYQYSILAYGVDRFNNIETPVVRTFKIVDNQAPQAQAQSISVAKNVARSITLTAIENENDAITYTVVTPPSHGTLSGTAPNLTYTPASNYTGSDSFSFSAGDWGPSTTTATVSLNVVDDTTNPTGDITKPDATTSSPLTSGTVTFYGTSNDNVLGIGTGSGVASVALYLYRDWGGTNEYWTGTGTGWSTTAPPVDAVLDPDVNGSRGWHWPSNPALPSVDGLATGRYQARAVVKDYANRTATITKSFFVGGDAADPTVTLTAPGANISRLTAVSGTATDADSGISQVQFRLRRSDNNQYWNGTAWTATTTALTATVTLTGTGNDVTWTRTTGLPTLDNGTYTIVPIAIDRYNNSVFGSTFSFTVANAYPAANAQSVTAIGHYGRAGDPTNITLTATDGNGDAVTSYHIVDEPLHGTLTGTAPNLIYTADADYIGSDSFTFAAKDFAGIDGDVATVSINVVAPPPVDALIKNSGDADYTGDDIISTDGTNETVAQTIFANGKAIYFIKVQKDDPAESVMLKVVGAAAASGWTVKYFDAQTNGLDITDEVTGENGWHPTLTASDTNFRVEVTPPSNLAAETSLTLIVSVAQENIASSVDVVKAVTIAAPTAQPDLELRLSTDVPYIGDAVVNATGEDQELAVNAAANEASVIHIKVRNTDQSSAAFTLKSQSEPDGWSSHYYDALVGGNEITTAIKGAGWTTGQIVPGGESFVRVEITPPALAETAAEWFISAEHASGMLDVVKITETPSHIIDKLIYSLDQGATWDEASSGNQPWVEIGVGQPVGLQAIKLHSEEVWDGNAPLWTGASNSGNVGPVVWLVFDDASTSVTDLKRVTASYGNSRYIDFHVLPVNAGQ